MCPYGRSPARSLPASLQPPTRRGIQEIWCCSTSTCAALNICMRNVTETYPCTEHIYNITLPTFPGGKVAGELMIPQTVDKPPVLSYRCPLLSNSLLLSPVTRPPLPSLSHHLHQRDHPSEPGEREPGPSGWCQPAGELLRSVATLESPTFCRSSLGTLRASRHEWNSAWS